MRCFLALLFVFFVLFTVEARDLRPHEDPSHPFHEHGVHADLLNDLVVATVDIARLAAHGPKRVIKSHQQLLRNENQMI
jgi:hypothetical protein